jgi:2-oxoglutarate ferredoxin oxidoreductase subunit gamma
MHVATQFAGFGGQGVLLMGYVLSHGAMNKGLEVTYFPSYGAEMRGGTANCT